MARSWVREIGFAAALAAASACTPGALQGNNGSGGRAGGSPGGAAGGSIGIVGTGGVMGQPCGVWTVTTPASQLDVLIVLDASGSMNEVPGGGTCDGGCGAGSKWAQATAAINQVVGQTGATINWGLELFGLSGNGCVVGGGPVAVGPANAPAIANAIARSTTANGGLASGGQTPTRVAVNEGAAILGALTDQNRKLILLVTDGAPNCIPGSADPNADDTDGSVATVMNAALAGIPTYVVGLTFPGGPADTALNRMAAAGGVARAGAPAYYTVLNTSDLIAVMDTMIATASLCTFPVPAPPTTDGTTSRGQISISISGKSIPQDTSHASGWDYTDPSYTHIQLYGPACDIVTNDPTAQVAVNFYCDGLASGVQ
jgi:hypothetical protein